jgi:hypothetical protein
VEPAGALRGAQKGLGRNPGPQGLEPAPGDKAPERLHLLGDKSRLHVNMAWSKATNPPHSGISYLISN